MTNRTDPRIGFRPVNAHGKSMRSGLPAPRVAPETLWRVMVETETGEVIPVFPAFAKTIASEMCAALSKAIIDGKIHGWRLPHLVKASSVAL